MNHYALTRIILLAGMILFSAACVQQPETSANKNDAALKQKVQTVWDAKVRKNWGMVYDMTTDAYKKTVSRNDFTQRANIQIETFDIKDAKVLIPHKEGQAMIDYTINQMEFKFHTTAKEKWIWENGNWHLHIPPASTEK